MKRAVATAAILFAASAFGLWVAAIVTNGVGGVARISEMWTGLGFLAFFIAVILAFVYGFFYATVDDD